MCGFQGCLINPGFHCKMVLVCPLFEPLHFRIGKEGHTKWFDWAFAVLVGDLAKHKLLSIDLHILVSLLYWGTGPLSGPISVP
jgi:hypothetical protein